MVTSKTNAIISVTKNTLMVNDNLKLLFPDFRIWLISLPPAVPLFLTSTVDMRASSSKHSFSFSIFKQHRCIMELPSEAVWLLGFFHLCSRARFAEHYSKMTSKKQGKYILYIKKKRKKKIEHRCSNVSCRIFNTFFSSTFYFLTAHKTFLSENICAILWIYVRRIPLYFQYHKHGFGIVACFIHSVSIWMKKFVFLWRTRKLF